MATITTKDGTQIYYKDWGKGQPIVFSHGWPLSADDWDAQMLFFLHHGYRVIAHDRRGHGRSTQTADGHDMDHYADDLAAVTAHLDLKNAVHVGHTIRDEIPRSDAGEGVAIKHFEASPEAFDTAHGRRVSVGRSRLWVPDRPDAIPRFVRNHEPQSAQYDQTSQAGQDLFLDAAHAKSDESEEHHKRYKAGSAPGQDHRADGEYEVSGQARSK